MEEALTLAEGALEIWREEKRAGVYVPPQRVGLSAPAFIGYYGFAIIVVVISGLPISVTVVFGVLLTLTLLFGIFYFARYPAFRGIRKLLAEMALPREEKGQIFARLRRLRTYHEDLTREELARAVREAEAFPRLIKQAKIEKKKKLKANVDRRNAQIQNGH